MIPNTISSIFTAVLTYFILTISTAPAHAQNTSYNPKGLSPAQVLALYARAMESHDANPTLPIYSKDTQEWKKGWSVNNTQMDNSARGIKTCGKGELKKGKQLAVIRYNPKNRECHPFYFVFEDGAWRMDFLTMMQTIRMNQRNLWHFSRTDHPYIFAFKDWRFDKNGYPHK